jgi:c-di-GMP-binding flagellar brake protein YcgR
MTLDTRPTPLDTGAAFGSMAEFLVDSSAEIHRLLRRLADGNVMVNLNAPDGTAYTTTLWTVDRDAGQLGFAVDVGDPRVQRLAEADELVVVGYLESVKLQFDLVAAVLVHGHAGSVLRAAIPRVMYRFQRRGSYRVRPIGRATPLAHLRHPAIADMALALRILDVSLGGCALLLPHDVPAVTPGVQVNDVTIDLDADTRFSTSLHLHHVTSMASSAAGVRLGCSMVSLAPSAERTLQRYIDQTQKKRRLFSLD